MILHETTKVVSCNCIFIVGSTCTPCTEDYFSCSNCDCIPLDWRCNREPDCTDGSDETSDCGKSLLSGLTVGLFDWVLREDSSISAKKIVV